MNRSHLALCCLVAGLALLADALPAAADSGIVKSVYSFSGGISGPDAANPAAGIVRGRDGNFYGTTVYGGSGSGAVYMMTPAGKETVLLSFDGTDGANPTGLTQGSDGDLYGSTYWGGPDNGYGTVYKISTSGVQTVLYHFTNGGEAGSNPLAAPVEGRDGNFYGTTTGGGAGGGGTLFRITPSGEFTVLHSFSGADGSAPLQLIVGRDGSLYGVTANGGAADVGTVFKMTRSGTFSVIYTFKGNPDGAQPFGPLLEASDGNFYGMTEGGGSGACTPVLTTNCGTVFKVTPAGQETVLHSFSGSPDDGTVSCLLCTFASSGLVEGPEGNLYGGTMSGGAYLGGNCQAGCGTLFMITPSGEETVLQSFVGPWSTPNDGWAPSGTLVQTSPGVFWGTTFYGVSGWGNVFRFAAAPIAASADRQESVALRSIEP